MADLSESQATVKAAGPLAPQAPQAGETLTEAAYRAIRHDIIRGRRMPGERLRIDRLRQIYDIGPTPIREALQKLSAEGLVHSEGNRGFTVAPLDDKEFQDLNVARTEVELAALRRSIAEGDSAWEARVVAATYLLEKADAALNSAEAGVPDSWEEANAGFHTALVSACGSDWLMRVRAGLQDLCERYRRAAVWRQHGTRRLNEEHAAIAKAALARDAETACALLRQHFDRTAQDLSQAMRAEPRQAGAQQ